MKLIFCLFCLLTITLGAPMKDRITTLPGLTFTPKFIQYAGYVNVDQKNGRNLFYWFVESQNRPQSDPLVVWFQGGPGCSSLLGLWTENGPFIVNDDGRTVRENVYSWNKLANVLYVEAPAGVGFSYSNTASDYTTGDNRTMIDNYNFLKSWMESFPEFSDKTRDVYLSGESYGGHYVPQLAWTIYNMGGIKVKGFIVGNAWTDNVIDSNSIFPFIYNHALCSFETWNEIQQNCDISPNGSLVQHVSYSEYRGGRVLKGSTPACDSALKSMWAEIGDNINQYDIYAPCVQNGGGLDCTNYTKEITYLNTQSVKIAIHAKTDLPKWEVCTNNLNYNESWVSVVPIYPLLIEQFRVMIYAGDVTFNVPFQGSQVWIASLGKPIIDRWTAWMVDGQVAGYVERYEKINFVTVRNAGHMVPEYQPKRAFEMFKNYLQGTF